MSANPAMSLRTSTAARSDWWRGAVIYQVYPRSFQDSDGDGVGDLAGITRRLPYIARLGVDAVWISPFYPSPMKDFGYDVSDYRGVDPLFGTLDDFDRLVAEAHRLGLRVLIDLVLSHTSDRHPWFAESRTSRDNPHADWYVWADPKPDGTPPNNWLSIFGGSAWHWESQRQQYYLHNFLASQPDLNLHTPAVQEALLDTARWWLDRGVDGFRLDTINFYFCDRELRDNPPLDPALRNASIAPAVNPYNWQEHIYDKNRPENLAFLHRFRALLDEYGATALGEVGDAQRGLEILGEYTAGDDLVQMCYAFELLSGDRPDATAIAAVFDKVAQVAPQGWACWAYSNHDVVRHRTRWALSEDAEKAFAMLLLCLRGSVCIFQGEELGLAEAELSFEDLRDPYGIEFWPRFKGRDGCRTPMVWEVSNRNGGFSTAERTWLPVPAEHLRLSVEEAEGNPASLLHAYRAAIALRTAHPALREGTMTDVRAEGPLLTFVREGGGERVFCAFNLSDDAASFTRPEGEWTPLGESGRVAGRSRVDLGPWKFDLAVAPVRSEKEG